MVSQWKNVKILTVNTNGIKQNGHNFIENTLSKYQLSCVQESKFRGSSHLERFQFHLDSSFTSRLFISDRGSELSHPTHRSRGGVLTIIKQDFPGYESAEAVSSLTIPGRYLVVRVLVDNVPFYIHNVYAPVDKAEKRDFFMNLTTSVFEDNAIHMVLGDLNTPLEPSLDASNLEARDDCSRGVILAWLAQLGVVDCWREHHPDDRVFTGPLPRRNRLDYVFLSTSMMNTCYHDSKYFVAKNSGDHLAQWVDLSGGQAIQGRGYWKLPCHLLEYPQIAEAIRNEAELLVPQLRDATNPGLVWEGWKKKMKKLLQSVQRKVQLQADAAVGKARKILDEAATNYRDISSDESKKVFQEALENYRLAAAQISQYRQDQVFDYHANNSEKSNRFFFRPPSGTMRKIPIDEVLLPDGNRSSDPNVISYRFLEHWGSIMGDANSPQGRSVAPPMERQTPLLDSITKTLSSQQQEFLETPLSASDLTQAIRHMKANSAPGLDGLTAGFYQSAPDIFGEILHIVFNYQLERGLLLPSQRKSCVVLLHKKGSRADPGNYRPIALMPVDAKILSKALTYRLQLVIPTLIHQDQKGFVGGRSIHHHIRFIHDLQHEITQQNEEGYALFLDFEKAYDRVVWDYLFNVLRRMGFGESFIKWIELLYKNPMAQILLNGTLQAPLYPTRGVKQGDPLSALLFVLTLEPLGNLLRRHEEHGICLTDDHVATSIFFADDTTLLSNSTDGLRYFLKIVDTYCMGSGAKLNLHKSVLLCLNRHTECPSVPHVKVLGRTESTKYLGIPIGQTVTDFDVLQAIEKKFYDAFLLWFRRPRTLQGRLLVTHTMVLSQLWHYSVHIQIPTATVQRWQSMVNRFILSRKYTREAKAVHLISQEFLYLPKARGGLQIPLLKDALKRQRLTLLQQFCKAATQPHLRSWATPASHLICHATSVFNLALPLDFLTISPMRHKYLIKWQFIPQWWIHTWKIWHACRWDQQWWDLPTPQKSQVALQQPLWLNKDQLLQFTKRSREGSSACNSTRSVGMVPEPQRSFRRRIAQVFKLRSLGDFLETNSVWPSQESFIHSHVDYRFFDVPIYTQLQWLKALYKEVLQIAQRVLPSSHGIYSPTPSTFVPTAKIEVGNRLQCFPLLSKKALQKATQSRFSSTKTHPVANHFQSSEDAATVVRNFLKFSKQQSRIMLPIFHDLQFRLAFKLLPVRSRFWFLQRLNSSAVCCPMPECTAVETEQHLFMDCRRCSQLWHCISQDWKRFFSDRISWKYIIFPHQVKLRTAWRSESSMIVTLWNLLRVCVLRFVWTERNRYQFDQIPPIPEAPALAVIFTTFCAHYRYLLRQHISEYDKPMLETVTRELQKTPNLGQFLKCHPGILAIRRQEDFRCNS